MKDTESSAYERKTTKHKRVEIQCDMKNRVNNVREDCFQLSSHEKKIFRGEQVENNIAITLYSVTHKFNGELGLLYPHHLSEGHQSIHG